VSKANALRAALQGERPVVAIGGHDGLSARLAEAAGFDAVWASGLEISTSAAVPDANILTMTDFLRAAREMNSATRLPIVADCDTGFGNSNNVIHMVRQYEACGIAAVCIEDKLFPKVNSFVPGRQELAPAWEFAGKIMAAKNSQELPDLVVIARLESLIAGYSVDDALRRAEAYRRAGADMILIHSKSKTPDQILEFLKRWDRQSPVAVVPTTFPQLTIDDWKAVGVNLVIFANHGMRAAIKAVQETYARIIAAGSTLPVEEEIAPMSQVFELQGMPAMKLDEERFLKNTAGSDVRAIILAGGTLVAGDLEEKLGGRVERPLLDIFGRTILQRQVDALSAAGVKSLMLVSNIPPEVVAENGPIEAVQSPGTGLTGTIMAGLDSLGGGEWSERNLLCYSDILFEPQTLESLLRETEDIVLLVDRSFREARPRKSSMDLVLTDPPPPSDLRALKRYELYSVKTISKTLELENSHFEFVGLCLLSAQGTRIFRQRFAEFEQAESAPGEARATSLNAFLQFLIDSGVPVWAREVRRGWLEVHDFEDYKSAVEQVKSR
jgi:phosphoenolpyruvate phosphomutase